MKKPLPNELAARFWLSIGRDEFAGIFIQKAYVCYSLWGASRKAEQLHETYHQKLPTSWPTASSVDNDTAFYSNRRIGGRHQGLELVTLMKASQAISSEILLNNLLRTMMKIVIENAGAEKGLLLLNAKDRLQVAAMGVADAKDIIVRPYEHMETETGSLPLAIINYVTRTLKYVVIKNTAVETRFNNDPLYQGTAAQIHFVHPHHLSVQADRRDLSGKPPDSGCIFAGSNRSSPAAYFPDWHFH